MARRTIEPSLKRAEASGYGFASLVETLQNPGAFSAGTMTQAPAKTPALASSSTAHVEWLLPPMTGSFMSTKLCDVVLLPSNVASLRPAGQALAVASSVESRTTSVEDDIAQVVGRGAAET